MVKDTIFSIIGVTAAVAVLSVFAWCASSRSELADTTNKLNEQSTLLQATQEELASVTENLQLEYTKSEKLAAELDSATKSLGEANETILALKYIEYELVYIGEFKLTHYCCELRSHICGTGDGITATGTQVTAGRTIAVDPTVIPYGSKVYIEGYGWRTADDCGGAVKNKQIDIAVETHSDALSMGVTSGGVWLLIEKDS